MPIRNMQGHNHKRGCAALLVSLSLLCGGVYAGTASADEPQATASEPAKAKPANKKKKKVCAASAAADDTRCVHAQTPRPLGSPPPGPVHSK